MDQLLKVKDKKIETLINKLQQSGISWSNVYYQYWIKNNKYL
jgi:hypothetical protein